MEKGLRQTKRDNHFDLLRIISTIAVIMIHVNWSYFGNKFSSPELSKTWVIESLLNIVLRFSVPCFVMMSGAYNIRKAGSIKLYKNVGWKIVIPTLIIGIILLVVQIAINVMTGASPLDGIRISTIIAAGIYDFWYVYMQIALYLITPLIRIIKRYLSIKHYRVFAVCMCTWAIISQSTSTYKLAYSIGVVIAYSSYYILGDVLYDLIKEIKKKRTAMIWGLVISFTCIAIAFLFRYKGFNHYTTGAYVNFFSPCVFVYSVMIFVIFGMMDVKRNFTFLSSKTFFMYLFHSIILLYAKKQINNIFVSELLSIVLLGAVVILISFVISFAFDKLWRTIEKKTIIREKWENLKIWKIMC